MANDNQLIQKIASLELELKQRDQEISKYRTELAKTNQELERIIADLAQELKMASQIQKILCPTQLPHIQGVEFSSKFVSGAEKGGDYFDIFEHEDRLKFGIVVAGSSGYSMSALFLSVLIKLSSQIEARRGIEPDLIISSMAKEIVPSIENQDTASVFYGFLDRRSFEFKYSLIGGILGFLQVHNKENLTRLLPSTGPLQKSYSDRPLAQSVQMGPRDRIILCTEGFLMAKNEHGDIFSAEKLSEIILRAPRSGVHELRNEILFQWEQFTGHKEPYRDLTVVVVEVKDRVIKLAK